MPHTAFPTFAQTKTVRRTVAESCSSYSTLGSTCSTPCERSSSYGQLTSFTRCSTSLGCFWRPRTSWRRRFGSRFPRRCGSGPFSCPSTTRRTSSWSSRRRAPELPRAVPATHPWNRFPRNPTLQKSPLTVPRNPCVKASRLVFYDPRVFPLLTVHRDFSRLTHLPDRRLLDSHERTLVSTEKFSTTLLPREDPSSFPHRLASEIGN